MKLAQGRLGFLLALLTAVVLMAGGCGPTDNKGSEAKDTKAKAKPGQVAEAKGHDHSDWWCAEHGVPEEICGQCSAKVAAELKKKGDWCKEHDRPDSQCFICHPELKEKFAAQYRAKYGKEPPPTEDEDKSKKEEKK
jgi:cobalt-zinc-cadmium efflux system membrane fusion protein